MIVMANRSPANFSRRSPQDHCERRLERRPLAPFGRMYNWPTGWLALASGLLRKIPTDFSRDEAGCDRLHARKRLRTREISRIYRSKGSDRRSSVTRVAYFLLHSLAMVTLDVVCVVITTFAF
jgi:hypothetical protein